MHVLTASLILRTINHVSPSDYLSLENPCKRLRLWSDVVHLAMYVYTELLY